MVISRPGFTVPAISESAGFIPCAALATASRASCQPRAYASRDAAFTILLISSTGSLMGSANQMRSEAQSFMDFLTHVKNDEAFHQFIYYLDDITGENKVVHRQEICGVGLVATEKSNIPTRYRVDTLSDCPGQPSWRLARECRPRGLAQSMSFPSSSSSAPRLGSST